MAEGEPQASSDPVKEPQLGNLFAGRYRIDRLLGRGMTGAVYQAFDQDVGDDVALKMLTPSAGGPDDAVERFRREVRVARRVTHRNAARIFDLGTVDGSLYLTMEFVDGESLHERLKREQRLTSAVVLDIAFQMASGLSAAHEVGVVHRDIKPANVMFDSTGRVVLTDFGLARAVSSDADVTLGPTMMGTPSYMAPEQVRGQAVGPAADLYAFGAVLYEMLTGQCPFIREDAAATAMARLVEDPVDPRQLVSIPSDLAELVLACLQREAEGRPDSAAQIARALTSMEARWSEVDATATLYSPTVLHPDRPSQTAPPRGLANAHSAASTFISIAPQDRTLAVLPFRFRGDPAQAYLSESMAEDLVDVLTTTRGLRVSSSGATAKYEGQSVDPREAGRELGVDAIVEGTVRLLGKQLRISTRLVDVATGEQLWVGRFDDAWNDDLELMEITAQRIAENLRNELELLGARFRVPENAIEMYLEATHRTERATLADGMYDEALKLLEKALEVAPDFQLGLAMHAELSVRRWFLPAGREDEAVARRAHESVERALAKAPDLARTHYAAGRLAVSDGRFQDAARELTLALSMAPTYAAVHDYLGGLQCEAGRGAEGVRHIELAAKLDPTMAVGPNLARSKALAGDFDSYREIVSTLQQTPSISRFMLESLEMRVAGWRGDLDAVRRYRPAAFIPPGHPAQVFYEAQRAALLGESTVEEVLELPELVLKSGAGPRLEVFLRQLVIEALAPMGAADSAIEQLQILAASRAFVDTDWLDRCQALDSLRSRKEFAGVVAEVRRRADAIWRVS